MAMKKILCVLLALMMVLVAFAGCAGGKDAHEALPYLREGLHAGRQAPGVLLGRVR